MRPSLASDKSARLLGLHCTERLQTC